jgi:nucleoside-diphosphate-sugar epimerase
MASILITGGAGFIGYHLARRLLHDHHDVDLIDNFSRGNPDAEFKELLDYPNVRFFNIDLLDSRALFELKGTYEYIFHFAALIGVKHVLRDPFSVLYKNTSMLNGLIQFARQQPRLKRLVFSSTSEVYAGTLQYFQIPFPTPEGTPLTVTELSRPRTSYMLSKIYGEALCHYSDLPFTIVRLHNIYGMRMGMDHVIPELLMKAHHASPSVGASELFVQNMSHSRTFCFIEDAVEMIVRLSEHSESVGKVLNVGNQAPEITIGDLALEIVKMMKKKMTVVPMPITNDPTHSPSRRCPDMRLTQQLIKYYPKNDLATGLRRTYDWYRVHV